MSIVRVCCERELCEQLQQEFTDVASYLTNGVTAKTKSKYRRWPWQWWIERDV